MLLNKVIVDRALQQYYLKHALETEIHLNKIVRTVAKVQRFLTTVLYLLTLVLCQYEYIRWHLTFIRQKLEIILSVSLI